MKPRSPSKHGTRDPQTSQRQEECIVCVSALVSCSRVVTSLGQVPCIPETALSCPKACQCTSATSQHAGLMWQDDFVASLFDDSTYTPSMLPNPMIPVAPLAPSNCAAVPRSSAETCRRTAMAPRSRDCQCAGVACRMHGKARRCAETAFSPTSYYHSAMCSMDLAQDAS